MSPGVRRPPLAERLDSVTDKNLFFLGAELHRRTNKVEEKLALVGRKISLHVDAVEPFLVLPADAPQSANLLEAAGGVNRNRGRLGAPDNRDHSAKSVLGGAVEQCSKQRLADAATRLLGVDVNAVLGGEAISGAVAELGDIGVAGNVTGSLSHEERPSGCGDAANLVAMEVCRGRLEIVGRGAVEHVVSIDSGDCSSIALGHV